MLQLRVVCEPELGSTVMAALKSHTGVLHVTRLVSSGPDDNMIIEAALQPDVAQKVIDQLVAAGVTETGQISLQDIDVMLSKRADEAAKEIPDSDEDAIIWDELLETTEDESALTPTFLVLLIVACLLAAVGILNNSAVTIVGAMVVSPDFGPLAALSVAAVGGRADVARRAGLALGLGYPLAIAVTVLFALLASRVGLMESGTLSGLGDVAFVYRFGPYSVIVALLAGVAGMIALTSRKSSALVGVFISITTVPAAGYAALAAVAGDWARCGDAMLQLGVNLVGVVLAGILTLWVRRRHLPTGTSPSRRSLM